MARQGAEEKEEEIGLTEGAPAAAALLLFPTPLSFLLYFLRLETLYLPSPCPVITGESL